MNDPLFVHANEIYSFRIVRYVGRCAQNRIENHRISLHSAYVVDPIVSYIGHESPFHYRANIYLYKSIYYLFCIGNIRFRIKDEPKNISLKTIICPNLLLYWETIHTLIR